MEYLALGIAWLAIWLAHRGTQLRRVEQKLDRLARQLGVDLDKPLPPSDRVKAIANDPARKIEAIKAYREETGAGLADAKRAVEQYTASLGH